MYRHIKFCNVESDSRVIWFHAVHMWHFNFDSMLQRVRIIQANKNLTSEVIMPLLLRRFTISTWIIIFWKAHLTQINIFVFLSHPSKIRSENPYKRHVTITEINLTIRMNPKLMRGGSRTSAEKVELPRVFPI